MCMCSYCRYNNGNPVARQLRQAWGKPAHSLLRVSASAVIDGATAATAAASKMLRGLSPSGGSREEGSEMDGLDG